jgi:SSS family solute:Na+ symporter
MVEIVPLIILITYIVLLLYASYEGFRRTKAGRLEFFVAAGTLGVIASFFTYVATWVSAYGFIGLSTVFYAYGIDWHLFEAMAYPFLIVPLTFIVAHRVWSLAKKYKYITPADLVVHRTGLDIPVRLLLAVMIAYPFIFYMGIQFIALSSIASGITGLPYHYGLFLFSLTAIIVVGLGGIRGVAYSDIIMGVTFLILVVVVIIVLPLYLGFGYVTSAVEGPRGWVFKPSLPPQYLISALFLVSIPWAGLIPHLMTKLYAAQSDRAIYASALGIGISGFLIYSILPIFVGSALAYYWPEPPKVTVREEYVTMFFSQLISPTIAMLLMIGLVAAAFSTIIGIAITLTSIVHVDLLEKTLKLKLSERTLDLIARATVILVMLIGVYSAVSPEHPIVRIAITLIWPGLSVIAFPILIALFWRRANKWGVFLGHLTGFLSLILFQYFIWPEWPHNPFYLWEGALPTMIGIVVTIIVSLITPPEPEERLKEFFP